MTVHQRINLPAPLATTDLVMKDGASIRLRRYGMSGSTRLVLSHGNGLAINAYAPFWLPLLETYDVVLFDMRNHGENPLHKESEHQWEVFYGDIEEIANGIRAHFGKAPTVGVFHSMSSIAALQHALRCGPRWDALCVFDPPIMPPENHRLNALEHADMEKHAARALRRPDIYDHPDQLAAQFRRRESFQGWVPEAADLLARHTLRQMPDGRWTLCCPPSYEGKIFRENIDPTLFGRLPDVPVPLKVIAGDPQSPHASPAAATAKAAHDELGIDYDMVPGTTHFLQIEQPQACRDHLNAFLLQHGLAALQFS